MIAKSNIKLRSLKNMSTELVDMLEKTFEEDKYIFQKLESSDLALYIYMLRDLASGLYYEDLGHQDTANEYYEECKYFLEDNIGD